MRTVYRVGLLVGGALGCGGDGTGPSCGSGGTATAVNVCDDFFAPASSPISAGATINWTWRGGNAHNVTFENGQGSSATQISGAHSRAFPASGTFRYRCTIHSANFSGGMAGSVTVQ